MGEWLYARSLKSSWSSNPQILNNILVLLDRPKRVEYDDNGH